MKKFLNVLKKTGCAIYSSVATIIICAILIAVLCSGCAGVSLATAWSMMCAGVGAGASVYTASKKTEAKADEKTDAGSAEKTESVKEEPKEEKTSADVK